MARSKPMTENEIARFATVLDITTDNARDLTRRLANDPTERAQTLHHGTMVLQAARALLDLHEAMLRPLALAELKREDPARQGQVPQGLLPRIGAVPKG